MSDTWTQATKQTIHSHVIPFDVRPHLWQIQRPLPPQPNHRCPHSSPRPTSREGFVQKNWRSIIVCNCMATSKEYKPRITCVASRSQDQLPSHDLGLVWPVSKTYCAYTTQNKHRLRAKQMPGAPRAKPWPLWMDLSGRTAGSWVHLAGVL